MVICYINTHAYVQNLTISLQREQQQQQTTNTKTTTRAAKKNYKILLPRCLFFTLISCSSFFFCSATLFFWGVLIKKIERKREEQGLKRQRIYIKYTPYIYYMLKWWWNLEFRYLLKFIMSKEQLRKKIASQLQDEMLL